MAKFRVETELSVGKNTKASGAFANVTRDVKQANKDLNDLKKTAMTLFAAFGAIKVATTSWREFSAAVSESIQQSEAATRSMKQIEEAAKGLHRTVGDSMAPGIQAAAEAIQASLASPGIQNALKKVGEYLGVMAMMIGNVASEVIDFVGSPGFQTFVGFLNQMARPFAAKSESDFLGGDAWKAIKQHKADVDAIVAAVEDWSKSVKKQADEEKKAAAERAKAAAEYQRNLRALRDAFDPLGAGLRKVAEEQKKWDEALKNGDVSVNEYQHAIQQLQDQVIQLTGAFGTVTPNLDFGQLAVDSQLSSSLTEMSAEALRNGIAQGMEDPPPLELEIREDAIQAEFRAINANFAGQLEAGVTGAFSNALVEFAHGGKDAIENLGKNLLDVLLKAVADYLAEMLVAQAKIAMAGKGATGGNTSAVGPVQPSGVSGMGGAMGTMGAVVGAAFAAYAVYEFTKQIKAANHAKGYGETAVTGIYGSGGRGSLGSSFAGEMDQAGRDVAKSMRDLLATFQQAAGQWLTSLPEIGMRIARDGSRFRAEVGGEIIGTFATLEEATLKAFQAAFNEAEFAGPVEQIFKDMVKNFRGEDVNQLKEALVATRNIMDEVAGLSQIEVALRDLPFQADAMRAEMVSLGASFEDASSLAAKWQATQLQNIRDQITGHEASAAEQRAQKEREALLFNAQLALNKAEIDMKRQKLAADIEILKAGGSLAAADLNLSSQYLGQVGRLSEIKADIYNSDLAITQEFLNLQSTAGKAALASLQLQLDALDQVFAILNQIKPIDLHEIHIPNAGGGHHGGGGNVNTGPSEAEIAAQQAIDDLASLWDQLNGIFSGLSKSWFGKVKALNDAMQEQIELAHGDTRALAAINAAYEQQIAALESEALQSLGLASVALTDQFDTLADTLNFLQSQGALTAEQFRELGDQMFLSLADGLLKYVDNEEARMAVEELRFQMEIANYRLQFQLLQAQGLLTQAQIDLINGLLGDIDAAHAAETLDFQLPHTTHGGGGHGGGDHGDDARARREDALRQALDRLRGAVDSLREFNENLLLSDLSPLTIEQQFGVAQEEYQRLLQQAAAGDLAAMEQLPDAAQAYLDLAAQMFDTSGAGYAGIFDLVRQQVAAIAAAGQNILDAAEPQMQGTEQRLDTIVQIQREMLALWRITTTWNPTVPGSGQHVASVSTGPWAGNSNQNSVYVHDPDTAAAVSTLAGKLDAIQANLATGNAIAETANKITKQVALKSPSANTLGHGAGRHYKLRAS